MKKLFSLLLILLFTAPLSAQDEVIRAMDASSDNRILYSGTWTISETYKEGGCNCAFSRTAGDWIEFSFIGSQAELWGEKVNTHGMAKVYLDGKMVNDSIDLYSEDIIENYQIYTTGSLNYGPHTIRLEVAGESNPESLNTYVVIDELRIWKEEAGPDPTPDPENVITRTRRSQGKTSVTYTREIQLQFEIQDKFIVDTTWLNSDTLSVDTLGVIDMSPIGMDVYRLTGNIFSLSVKKGSTTIHWIASNHLLEHDSLLNLIVRDPELFKSISEAPTHDSPVVDADWFLVHSPDEYHDFRLSINTDYYYFIAHNETEGIFSDIVRLH